MKNWKRVSCPRTLPTGLVSPRSTQRDLETSFLPAVPTVQQVEELPIVEKEQTQGTLLEKQQEQLHTRLVLTENIAEGGDSAPSTNTTEGETSHEECRAYEPCEYSISQDLLPSSFLDEAVQRALATETGNGRNEELSSAGDIAERREESVEIPLSSSANTTKEREESAEILVSPSSQACTPNLNILERGLRGNRVRNKRKSSRSREVKFSEKRDERIKRSVSNVVIRGVVRQGCCEQYCLQALGTANVKESREHYYALSWTEQGIFLKGNMSCEGSRLTEKYHVRWKEVCHIAFKKIFLLGNSRLANLRAQINDPPRRHRQERGQNESNAKGALALEWMQSFFLNHSERLPDRAFFHLPNNFKRNKVWLSYVAFLCEKDSTNTIVYQSLGRLWRENFSFVRIPQRNQIGSCGLCEKFKNLRDRSTTTGERNQAMKLLEAHREAQSREREKLAKHRKKCYAEPRKYLGLFIDGMDQKKTELPHFVRVPKNADEKYFVAVHVVGALVFNGMLQAKVFLNYPDVANDSNLTIHILNKIITTWEGYLPPVLYLQLDNTTRENKNKYLLGYLSVFVQLRIFKKVKLGFLLVGHTHDQIDQMFSRFSYRLARVKACNVNALVEVLESYFKPKTEVIFVDEVADVRSLFETEKCLSQLRDVSFQYQTKIDRDGLTSAVRLPNSNPWKNTSSATG